MPNKPPHEIHSAGPGGTQRIVIETPRPARRLLIWFLALCLLISVAVNLSMWGSYQSYFQPDDEIEEKYHSLSKVALDKVAIIKVSGVIVDGEGFAKAQIDRVLEDDRVKAVVLRVDSPGGTVAGSDVIHHQLKNMLAKRGIPMVVSMGSIAASGGYYVSMAVGDQPDSIYAEPSTFTGSIGVVIPHYTVAGLMEKFQVEDDSIASHRLKLMGSPTRTMTEEERAIFDALVADGFERFKEVVRSGRPIFRGDEEDLDRLATGQVFSAEQALKDGLIDRVGYLEDAIDRVIELAKLDRERIRVVRYVEPYSLFEPFDITAISHPSNWEGALLDPAPRPYYLAGGAAWWVRPKE